MHWLSVYKTVIQGRTICDKDYDSDRSNVNVMEDDDVSFSIIEDLVGMGEGSTDDNESFLSFASEELDGSDSDSSGNRNESDDDDDDDDDNYDDDDEYLEASGNDSGSHIAKRQRT
jgi:hypothetical protein